MLGGALAAVLVLGVGGFFAFSYFTAPEPPPLARRCTALLVAEALYGWREDDSGDSAWAEDGGE